MIVYWEIKVHSDDEAAGEVWTPQPGRVIVAEDAGRTPAGESGRYSAGPWAGKAAHAALRGSRDDDHRGKKIRETVHFCGHDETPPMPCKEYVTREVQL